MELIELSVLVDNFDRKRTERLDADKVAKSLKQDEDDMSSRIIAVLYENDTYFAAGKRVRVKLNVTTKPVATDWSVIYDYMVENDAMDLVQKRLHHAAINDRLDEGEEVPGIEFVEVTKLSIGKI